jgi:hypothetical protein
MKHTKTLAPSAYFAHPETSLSSKLEASPPGNYMHFVLHPRNSEQSTAPVTVQLGLHSAWSLAQLAGTMWP